MIEDRAGAGGSLRRRCPPVLWAAGLCAVAAAVALPWDGAVSRTLLEWQRRAPAVNELLEALRHPGRGELTVLGVLGLAALGWRRQAWQVLAALIALGVVVTALKYGVGRPRPIGSALSFPSGDVATAAALVFPWSLRLRRWTWIPALLVTGVALSRMAQGAHYPSDVLAGTSIGLVAGWAGTLLPWPRWARWWSRRRVRRSWPSRSAAAAAAQEEARSRRGADTADDAELHAGGRTGTRG